MKLSLPTCDRCGGVGAVDENKLCETCRAEVAEIEAIERGTST